MASEHPPDPIRTRVCRECGTTFVPDPKKRNEWMCTDSCREVRARRRASEKRGVRTTIVGMPMGAGNIERRVDASQAARADLTPSPARFVTLADGTVAEVCWSGDMRGTIEECLSRE